MVISTNNITWLSKQKPKRSVTIEREKEADLNGVTDKKMAIESVHNLNKGGRE